MKIFIKILKGMGIALALILFTAVLVFGYLTLTEYRPADTESVPITTDTSVSSFRAIAPGDSISIMSWNIGYGALGDNADFFMDGGKSVNTADEQRVRENLTNIADAIDRVRPTVLMMQEVDISSSRSHRINEQSFLDNLLAPSSQAFALNFKVDFVPYPIPPIGKVESGILTFTDAEITSAERLSLPCPYRWPVRVGNLKRCLLITRIPLEGTDKELVMVNLHLEAYDNGEGKIAQTKMLRSVLEQEAAKGNYVIAGGDFNQTFSNVDISNFPVQEGMWAPGIIDREDFSDFVLLMDDGTPSCRSLDRVYAGANRDAFQYYCIDGFILSGNVRADSCGVQDLDFVSTDHNPVILRATLLRPELPKDN
ncbi:MAG: endonuclease [Lachnospiraceae bacterium]|nr:endonuclease [Lachnospiraceae bacterium]